jgi:hypothetical protein
MLSESEADLAALSYALLPWSFIWLVQGGGVTRAPGVLFAVLALWALASRRWTVFGVFLGLTIATHPEAALFAAMSSVIVWAVRGYPRGILRAVPVAVAISMVWLVILIPRFGVSGLVNGVMSRAVGFGDDSIRKVIVIADLWPITLLGLLGAAIALRYGRSRWIVLWALLCALLPGAIGRWVAVPWSLLAGLALAPWLSFLPRARFAVAAAALALAILAPLATTVPALPASDRARMLEIADTVDPNVTFAVYGSEVVVEWFPYLAEHRSTTTSVGFEWVGGLPPAGADRVYR